MISKLIQLLKDMTPVFYFPGIIFYISEFLQQINWLNMIKVTGFYVVALLEVGVILFINDYVFDYFGRRRIKTHKMKITNNGNTSSIFLLRTVELPQSLAIRFRIDGNPLIWITRKDREKSEKRETKTEKAPQPVSQPAEPVNHSDGLIPDLKNPLNLSETVDAARQGAGKAQKKLGLFAAILGGISSLLPKSNSTLQNMQGSLRGAQQDIGQSVAEANTKINSADMLKSQVGSLVPEQTKSTLGSAVDNGQLNDTWNKLENGQVGSDTQQGDVSITDSAWEKDFAFEDKVWQKNIGKKDQFGGSLNYAQSKILEPGESMQIDIEIMNLSVSSAPVSHLYKIEVVQIPQTNLQLAAPNQYVNGIVIYPKASPFQRLLPPMIMIALLILSIMLLTLFSYILF